MSSDWISLTLSTLGLLLGFVSAYPQIKSFMLKATKIGGKAARSWAIKEQSLVELYLEQPAALVAYLGKSSVSIFLFIIALLFLRPLVIQELLGVPAGTSKFLSLIPACLIGLVLGAITSRCSDVLQLAWKRKTAPSAS